MVNKSRVWSGHNTIEILDDKGQIVTSNPYIGFWNEHPQIIREPAVIGLPYWIMILRSV